MLTFLSFQRYDLKQNFFRVLKPEVGNYFGNK